jgi:hypothetical protein
MQNARANEVIRAGIVDFPKSARSAAAPEFEFNYDGRGLEHWAGNR